MATNPVLLAFSAALLGAIFGSFINALAFRYRTGEGLGGRSHCMQCGHKLSAGDLIPILSFLFLRGRCRYCGARLSLQYPLVELAAALVSLWLYVRLGIGIPFAFGLFVSLTLLFAVVYDLRHMILPPEALAALALAACAALFVSCASAACHMITPSLMPLLSGPALAAPLLLLSAVSRGRWMGWGDGWLELSLGWLTGLGVGLSGLFIAFWSGAITGLSLVAYSRRSGSKRRGTMNMRSEIPFAPFLVFGAAVAYFFHVDFFTLLF